VACYRCSSVAWDSWTPMSCYNVTFQAIKNKLELICPKLVKLSWQFMTRYTSYSHIDQRSVTQRIKWVNRCRVQEVVLEVGLNANWILNQARSQVLRFGGKDIRLYYMFKTHSLDATKFGEHEKSLGGTASECLPYRGYGPVLNHSYPQTLRTATSA